MGAYLDRPITESHYDYGKNDKIKYVAASMQGWRTEQEDAHNAILDLEKGIHMFAVYDGHGGKDVSTYTADHFPQYLIQQENWKNKEFSNALNDAFISFDDVLRQPEVLKILNSGTTACVVVIHNENITVANAGDSRAVLCRNGKAIELSFDHKPEDKSEKSRIVKAGGTISADGRVNGGLNLSRALGDHYYKQNKDLPLEEQMISAKPDIIEDKITDEDEFLIIACDGIWNSMSSQEVVDFVKELWGKETLKQICDKIMANCLADNTDGDGTGCDNMTIIIVDLKNTTELGQFDNIEDTKQIE
uniref:protein-serine/threonine phosphatase n=1 Tax=Strongyloides stercoralis TaxID=6248 RepID=A0AAF5D0M2_STRER